jgi:hypothetical protein
MNKFTFYPCGLALGSSRITYPLGILIISKNSIQIFVLFMRIYNLKMDEIFKIEKISNGIEIYSKYPKRMIIWSFNTNKILKSIESYGLHFNLLNITIHNKSGNPIKGNIILFILSAWVLSIIIYNIIESDLLNKIIIAINIMLIISIIFIPKSKKLQKLILNKEYDYENIRPEVLVVILNIIVFIIIYAIIRK